MTTVSVVIPFRGYDEHRERLWARLQELWIEEHPTYEIVVASDRGYGPWIKAAAWLNALEQSTGDIVVFCDADCWLPRVAEGVEAVWLGARWAQAQDVVYRLSPAATDWVLAGNHPSGALRMGLQEDDPPRRSTAGVGTVLRRQDALDVPLDPRFVGWGWEDTAWYAALRTLLGPEHRLEGAACVHLWHEPQVDKDRRPVGSNPNWLLRRRYARAEGRPEQMRELIEEFSSSEA